MGNYFSRIVAWTKNRPNITAATTALFTCLWIVDQIARQRGRALAVNLIVDWAWWFLAFLGPCIVVPLGVFALLYGHWEVLAKKWRHLPFELRPMHGDALHMPLLAANPGVGVARLGVKNVSGRLLERCSVRLLDAFYLNRGILWNAPGIHPSVHELRGETFVLRWADKESATPDRKYLDIPCDGVERIVEVLVIDETNPVFALFAAANPNDSGALRGVRDDWCKLRLVVGSLDCSQQIELVAACGDRGGPITLDHWTPRGEAIAAEQRTEWEAQKRARAEARAERRKQETQAGREQT